MALRSRAYHHTSIAVTLAILVPSILAVACSAVPSSSKSAQGGGNTGGASASTSSTSTSASSTTSSSGLGGFNPGTGGSSGKGGGCVGTASKANPVPLDVFVMLDQSGSMSQPAGNGLSRWENVRAALTTFVQQPNVTGMSMGLQYFGLPLPSVSGCVQQTCTTDSDCTNGCTTCGPGGVCHAPYNPDVDSCDGAEYAWAEVPIQPLPGVGNAILGSLEMHAPGTNTPTMPALQGAIQYAAAWQVANPTHITVVALATDGDPSECDTDLTDVDGVAAAGLAGAPSIRTFVIGVGPSMGAQDAIAAAGGTTAAYHVDVNTMATQELVQYLSSIRGAAIACTYQIPSPKAGMMLDFSLVNVEYLPGKGPPNVTIPKVTGKAACPATGSGWYYDDEASPTELILCPATCAAVSQDDMGEVDVVLGCTTIVK